MVKDRHAHLRLLTIAEGTPPPTRDGAVVPRPRDRAHTTQQICIQAFLKTSGKRSTRDGAVAARRAHNPEVGGANPPPAPNTQMWLNHKWVTR